MPWTRSKNKKFSGWVGEVCHSGTRLDRFDCNDDGKDCEEQCAKECDKDSSCDAYVTDDDTCQLYDGCDIIWNDGCDDCSVHVCLENCPSSTSSWFGSFGYWECTASALAKRDIEYCENGRNCDPMEECARLCEDNSKCTTFMLDDDAEDCELFKECDSEYDDDWDEHFIGHIRYGRLVQIRHNDGSMSPGAACLVWLACLKTSPGLAAEFQACVLSGPRACPGIAMSQRALHQHHRILQVVTQSRRAAT